MTISRSIFLSAFAILGCCLVMAKGVRAEWLHEERSLMGTSVSVELWADNPAAGAQVIERVFLEFHRLDRMMNPWNPDSELARINREAGKGSITTTQEIMTVIDRALHYSHLSNGAFDISFASVGQFYDYRQGQAPKAAKLEQHRGDIDFRAIEIDMASRRIGFSKAGLQIDLGGIAKGYAVDRGISIVQEAGLASAIISAGGDSRILGDLGGRARTVGIRHPRREGEYAVLIPLADTAISTSGDYERFFIADGERYHHILDPGTGRSAHGVQSASILASHAIDSDALSTTIFVLGVERGLALVNKLPDIDAIIIDENGKLHYSEELLLSVAP